MQSQARPTASATPALVGKTYRCALHVRGYELDSFGHVNHGVYVSYLEHARWQLLHEEGITLETFKEWKTWPVISHIELDYLKPTYLGDELTVETTHLDHGKTWMVFHQVITKAGVAVLRASVKVVTVNEAGRPCPLPARMERCWTPEASNPIGAAL
jgi:acyl-CoA thioester hydrolase